MKHISKKPTLPSLPLALSSPAYFKDRLGSAPFMWCIWFLDGVECYDRRRYPSFEWLGIPLGEEIRSIDWKTLHCLDVHQCRCSIARDFRQASRCLGINVRLRVRSLRSRRSPPFGRNWKIYNWRRNLGRIVFWPKSKNIFPFFSYIWSRTALEHDRLLNVNWRLDLQLKTNHTDKLLEPIYILDWTKTREIHEHDRSRANDLFPREFARVGRETERCSKCSSPNAISAASEKIVSRQSFFSCENSDSKCERTIIRFDLILFPSETTRDSTAVFDF